jgi:hypothetical protein
VADVVDIIMARLNSAATQEMQSIGGEVLDDFRERVAEEFPPPSEPGTPPHQRTGEYRDGFYSRIDDAPEKDQVELDVGNPAVLSRWLEFGTVKMQPRQHFQPVFDDWRTQVGPRLKTAMQQG